jgi:hypothetical protein
MRSAPTVVLALLAAVVVGCGSSSEDSGSSGSSNGGGGASVKKAEQEIEKRELAALPDDPNFLGEPAVAVSCSGSSCTAILSADLAENIPLGEDHWTVKGGKATLKSGSNIVGFMAADAHYECMSHMADTGDRSALESCAEVVAHKQLP